MEQTAGEVCYYDGHLLEVTVIVGECPMVQAKFNGVVLSCLVDTGSQVTTIAKPCRGITPWGGTLKPLIIPLSRHWR